MHISRRAAAAEAAVLTGLAARAGRRVAVGGGPGRSKGRGRSACTPWGLRVPDAPPFDSGSRRAFQAASPSPIQARSDWAALCWRHIHPPSPHRRLT
jgi:hypothetical protein